MNSVITRINGCVLQVILNRPDKRNAFNPEVINTLTRVFTSLSIDSNLRLIHIAGSGPDFCVGADLHWMASCSTLCQEKNIHDADNLFKMYQSMLDCPIPIITQVHGHIYGGGIGLCAASDVVIADHASIFSLSEAKRGLIPAVMMPFIVNKLGNSRARELLITGRKFSTKEALDYGLVHFMIKQKNKTMLTQSIIQNIITSAPDAILQCRRLLNASVQITNRQYLVASLANKRVSAEAREGINSFFEKRQPAWSTANWFLDEYEEFDK